MPSLLRGYPFEKGAFLRGRRRDPGVLFIPGRPFERGAFLRSNGEHLLRDVPRVTGEGVSTVRMHEA